MFDWRIPEERLNYFEWLAKTIGTLDGLFALELIDEVRRLRERYEKRETEGVSVK